jgi:LacI family transcriptional regulator
MHVTGNLSRNVYSERFQGFKQALIDNNLEFNNENLIINNLSPENGIEVAQELLKRVNQPDGILITNDICAANCIQELKKHGVKIPADIAIAGFNNDLVSNLIDPPLTTINYKGFEMGEIAIQTMINQINQPKNLTLTQSIVLNHEIIIRASTLKSLSKQSRRGEFI